MLSLLALALVAMTAGSSSASKPIQLSLWDGIQIFSQETEIGGLRLAIYGRNDVVKGVDIGIFMRTTNEFVGVQWGIVGWLEGNGKGWQASDVNIVGGEFTGVQAPALYNQAGTMSGFQGGAINRAGSFKGFQLGIVNWVDNMDGLQIGLFNMITAKEKFSWLPIVNWQF